MKLSVALTITLVVGLASDSGAFAPRIAPSTRWTTSTTTLNLFGGKKTSGDGGGLANKGGGGMMDQLAMLKKATEVAGLKKKIDEDLAAESFEGIAADGKVTVVCKFVPSANPMDPQPEYEVASVSFEDGWYESASPEDISDAVKAAIANGTEKANAVATEKYNALAGALKGMGAPGLN
jgi:DNA-binding protein YbaB